MKLRSGKIIGEKQINLTSEIKSEIKSTLSELRNLLKNNLEFFFILIEKSLLLGKDFEGHTVYREEINDLIWQEYPDLNKHKDRLKLLTFVSELGHFTYGDHQLIRNEIMKNFQEDFRERWEEYRGVFQDKIEKEVCSILPTLAELQEVNIVGELQEEVNDLEM